MATVYKGYQEEIDRFVAIKVLPPHPGQDSEFAERFQLEARTIARLQHPHILPVYDYGQEGDTLYLVVAYIEGGSLSDRIDRGPMALKTVESYLREIASALDFAHRQGVVHRDIKPDNILINTEGYTLLADFGIAKLVSSSTKLTATGGLVGTPAYMAPEQAQGGEITPAVDIYSLGVVAYEMVTGRQPYTADTPIHVMMKHVTEPVPRISSAKQDLPLALESVMLRVMAKHPEDRYATATEFVEDFSRAISGRDVTPLPLRMTDTLVMGEPSETRQFSAPGTMAANPTQAVGSPSSTNMLLIVGGVVVIALLVIAIVALVIFTVNQSNSGVASNPTAAPTRAPTEAIQAIPPATSEPSLGTATFSTATTIGDMLTLRANRMPPTAPGENYVVWLQNTDSGDVLNTGTMKINALGEGTLTYTDGEGRFLPGLFNAVAISRESTATSETPQGEIEYQGSYPIAVAAALTSILKESADGIDGSSLTQSALSEGQLGRQHANLAASSTNIGGVLTHTEHTINILLGGEEDYNGNGRGENPSRSKLGVVHFLDLIDSQMDSALESPGTTTLLESEAELIRVCVNNARLTIDQIIPVETDLLKAADMDAAAPLLSQSTLLLDVLVDGVDLDGSGQIDPFEGECSLQQIERFGVLAGVIAIQENKDQDA
ncbi:MAG: protein kinase [Anaerolineae bacterium]|nr:protein kinase [Anaerolineae bacterium]